MTKHYTLNRKQKKISGTKANQQRVMYKIVCGVFCTCYKKYMYLILLYDICFERMGARNNETNSKYGRGITERIGMFFMRYV